MKRLLTILCMPALLLFGGPSEGYAFDKLSLKKLRAMNHCPKCDLSGASLSGTYLVPYFQTEKERRGIHTTAAGTGEVRRFTQLPRPGNSHIGGKFAADFIS